MSTLWQLIPGAETTWRLPVPGGWLYRDVARSEDGAATHAMCFVPDARAEHVHVSPGGLPPGVDIDPAGTART